MNHKRVLFIAAMCLLEPLALLGSTSAPRVAPPHRDDAGARHAWRIAPSGSKQINWPQFGLDSGHTAYNSSENTISPSNVSQLQQAWSFSTGGSNTAGNVVYADGGIYAASSDGTLFALDASTGNELWHFASGTGHQTSGSTPAVDKGLVFTVCNLQGGGQGLCALNASTGSVQWSYALPGSSSYAATPPVFSGGSVYLEVCGSSCSYVALNEKNGKVLWTVADSASCPSGNGVTPSVANGLVYVAISGCPYGGYVCALAAASGATVSCGDKAYLFEGLSVGRKYGFFLYWEPGGFEGIVRFTVADGFYHYSGWGVSAPFATMPAFVKNVVYVAQIDGSDIAAYKAKAKSPGKLIFEAGLGYSSPSIGNDVIYTACLGEHPCGTNATNGNFLWGQFSGPSNSTTPVIANGVVYGGCNGNEICAYTLPNRLRRR